jgi:ribosomal protein L40E
MWPFKKTYQVCDGCGEHLPLDAEIFPNGWPEHYTTVHFCNPLRLRFNWHSLYETCPTCGKIDDIPRDLMKRWGFVACKECFSKELRKMESEGRNIRWE